MRMLLKIPDDVDHVLARRVLRHRHEVKVQVRLSALILVYLGGHHISLSVALGQKIIAEPEEPAFLRLRKILGLGDDPAAHGAHVLTLHTVELRQPLLQIVRRGHVSVGRQRIIQVRPAAVDVGVGRISDLPQDMPQLIRVRSLPEFLHGCHAFPPFKRWAVCRSGTLPNHVRRTANTYTRQQR